MRKFKKIIKPIIIILVIIALIFLGYFLYIKLTPINIPDNPNLMITFYYHTEPSSNITYYFYDNMIIQRNSSSGVLPEGLTTSSTKTKYKFKENIDITSIKNNIEAYEKVEKITLEDVLLYTIYVKEKDGVKYYLKQDENKPSIRSEINKLIENANQMQTRSTKTTN